ncbi:hypothetical protein G3M81_22960 [Bacillus paralicheniformis]|jgi:hypothetical protein|uniref:hypothetical protein n=1 Tax=Bacillus TaxID=1386 RepID=UPI0013EEBD43|nr:MULTISPECIES: hypothetical protein [Bacillus]QII26952.1 hypothetical protein G3M80_20870 [Bacillus altitudinis]QII51420.1 hypothetical protein G3M81_22960 [Bacillus paralicheniformis]
MTKKIAYDFQDTYVYKEKIVFQIPDDKDVKWLDNILTEIIKEDPDRTSKDVAFVAEKRFGVKHTLETNQFPIESEWSECEIANSIEVSY